MDDRTPGYYAIIPAAVRYDDRLQANAKLLYGEISALLNDEGYCFSNNAYFAQIYQISERTVTNLIASLQKCGYIFVQMEHDASGQVKQRRIYLTASAGEGQPLENIFYTPRKNFLGGIEKNFQYTDIYNNIYNNNIYRAKTKESLSSADTSSKNASRGFDPWPSLDAWICKLHISAEAEKDLRTALNGFLENRRAIKKPVKSERAVTILCNRLSELSGADVNAMRSMLDDAVAHNWQSVYAPKNGQPSAVKSTASMKESTEEWL